MSSDGKPTGHRRTSSGLCPNSPIDRSEGGVTNRRDERKKRKEKRLSFKEMPGLFRGESPDKEDAKAIQDENANAGKQVDDTAGQEGGINDDIDDDEIIYQGHNKHKLAHQVSPEPQSEFTYVRYRTLDRAPKPGSSSESRQPRPVTPDSPSNSDGDIPLWTAEGPKGGCASISSVDEEEGGAPLYGWSDDEEKPAPVEGKGKGIAD